MENRDYILTTFGESALPFGLRENYANPAALSDGRMTCANEIPRKPNNATPVPRRRVGLPEPPPTVCAIWQS